MSQALVKTEATVVKLSQGYVWLAAESKSGCGSCQQSSCGQKTLASYLSPRAKPLKLTRPNSTLEIGDRVYLVMHESDLVKDSMMAYGLPLTLMFIAALTLPAIFSGFKDEGIRELWIALSAFLGLLSGWWATQKIYSPKLPTIEKMNEGP
jgi:sigma-E factor negative regulatory protein RseC